MNVFSVVNYTVNGNNIELSGGIFGTKLRVNGKKVPAKMRSTFFDDGITRSSDAKNEFIVNGIKIAVLTGSVIVNDEKYILLNGEYVKSTPELEKISKEANEKQLKEQLNKGQKKYSISLDEKDCINVGGRYCRRIIALEDLFNENGKVVVAKGTKGGYIESRYNLSDESSCWIADDAIVCDNAYVSQNALVAGKAEIYGNVKLVGNAVVCDNAEVYGNVKVCDNAIIGGQAKVYGNVKIFGDAVVNGMSELNGNVRLGGGKIDLYDFIK